MHESASSAGNPESWRGGEYHFTDVSAHEAAAINATVQIKAYAAVHGHGPAEAHIPSLDAEYEAVKGVVDSLDAARCDVLFREARAHDEPYQPIDWSTIPGDPEATLEHMRQNRDVDAFTYASELANLRGVPVVFADISQDAMSAFTSQVPPDEMAAYKQYDPAWPWQRMSDEIREEQSAATIKDYALDHMPELQGRYLADQERPTYALLLSPGHFATSPERGGIQTKGVEAAFEQMGLQAEVTHLPNALAARQGYDVVYGAPQPIPPMPPSPPA